MGRPIRKKHSTNQCTFALNEVLQYYGNNNSNTLLTLIDASKEFDVHTMSNCLNFNIKKYMSNCSLILKCIMYK